MGKKEPKSNKVILAVTYLGAALFLGLAGACWCRFAGDQAVSRFLLGVLWCLLGAALLLKFAVSP